MKLQTRPLMQEAAIGALAQLLLPSLLSQKLVVHHYDFSLFPRLHEKAIDASEAERVSTSFRVAEMFLDMRTARLRASEAQLQHRRDLRQKRKVKKRRAR